jgi:hypothetical protein
VFHALVYGLVGLALGLTAALLPATRIGGSPWARAVILALAGWAFLIEPRGDFGQREHLILAFLLPYLVVLTARADGGRPQPAVAIAAGALAAIAVGVKPFYLVVPTVLEAYLWLRLRSRWRPLRVETAALILVGLGEVAGVLVLLPEYLGEGLPLALLTYGAYELESRLIMVDFRLLLLVGALALSLGLPARPDGRAWNDILRLATVGTLFAAVIQNKGWSYHFYPVWAIALLWAGSAALLRLLGPPPSLALPRRLAAAVGLGLTLLVGLPVAYDALWRLRVAVCAVHCPEVPWHRDRSPEALLYPLFREHAGEPVYVVSTAVDPAFPAALDAGVRWAGSHCCLWPIPAIAAGAGEPDPVRRAALDRARAMLIEHVARDFAERRPRLVVVEVSEHIPFVTEPGFDLLGLLLEDERFRALWAPYRPAGELRWRDRRFALYLTSLPTPERPPASP